MASAGTPAWRRALLAAALRPGGHSQASRPARPGSQQRAEVGRAVAGGDRHEAQVRRAGCQGLDLVAEAGVVGVAEQVDQVGGLGGQPAAQHGQEGRDADPAGQPQLGAVTGRGQEVAEGAFEAQGDARRQVLQVAGAWAEGLDVELQHAARAYPADREGVELAAAMKPSPSPNAASTNWPGVAARAAAQGRG
jgi:hypothetical protein